MTRLAAAFTMGAGEVGAEALADAIGTFLPGLDMAPLAAAAREAEESGTLEEWTPAGAVDLLALLDAASAQEMAAARRAAMVIAGVGGLYLLHGLGMRTIPCSPVSGSSWRSQASP